MITLDTMRADRLPAYGFDGGVATAALDRLAAEGVLFEAAFASVPLTLPSHASLFTGLYPPQLGVRDNAGAPLGPEFTTLAETLRGTGYRTAAFVASSVIAADRGVEQGFTTYDDGTRGCDGMPRSRRRADEIVDAAIDWLSRQDAAPFFAWVHLYDTHRPYDLPVDYERLYADAYLAAIAFEDAQIGRLLDYLQQRARLDETLIVVAGDHGESLGDHGEEAHGIFVYQEVLRVPLLMRGPGIAPRRVRAAARLVDVLPTVLSMLDVRPPVEGDGRDLRDLLTGGADPQLEVYAESMYPRRFGWSGLRSLRADRYKVIAAPRPELYDLAADPFEQHNLFDARPAVGRAMLRRLDDLETPGGAGADIPGADPAVLGRLSSLGYAHGIPSGAGISAALPDPKDHIEDFNRMTTREWERLRRRAPGPSPCGVVSGELPRVSPDAPPGRGIRD